MYALHCIQRDPTFGQPAHHLRIEMMLYGQHPFSQRIGRVVDQHRHRALRHDGAMIEHRSHKVNSAAMPLHTGCQRLLMRM